MQVGAAAKNSSEALHRAECRKAALKEEASQSAAAAEALESKVESLEKCVAELDAACLVLKKQVL
jgi:hypothetical protein